MTGKKSWRKIYHPQKKSGWCGPAVIQMALASAGIKKTQKEIAKAVYQAWWGTTNHTIIAYLSHFFLNYGSKAQANIKELQTHLKNKHTIIVNWWDDIDESSPPDGHYSLVLDINRQKREITLADPSKDRGIWKLKIKDFEEKWYDYLDAQKKKIVRNWFLWFDPKIIVPNGDKRKIPLPNLKAKS